MPPRVPAPWILPSTLDSVMRVIQYHASSGVHPLTDVTMNDVATLKEWDPNPRPPKHSGVERVANRLQTVVLLSTRCGRGSLALKHRGWCYGSHQ
jgi:hypothetical protein